MSLQEMKDARNKAVVAFTKFSQDKEKYNDCLFCFYEGEDIKYYEMRIEQYTSFTSMNIISYNCGGRIGVLKIHKKIHDCQKYSGVQKAFFIDRDFNPLEKYETDIYQTPCYSVENLYTTVEAFKKILKREFLLNICDEDFTKCVNDFIKRQEEFHEEVLLINSWIFNQRKLERDFNHRELELSDFKVTKFFEKIQIDKIEVKEKLDKQKIEEIFPDIKIIDQILIDEAMNDLRKVNMQYYFRGKFELEFLKKIIDDMRNKNRNNIYFYKHLECVRIDANGNPLSSLNQYANTPECLVEFLNQYIAC
jgi:hypothetical protein